VLTPAMTQAYCDELLITEGQRATFEKNLEVDFSYGIAGLARFRVNLFHQRESCGAVLRAIPFAIPLLESMNFGPVIKELCAKPRGLVLVTGPTGSGKSTTLAAMIDHINATERGHILTLEDPIEFVHSDKKCFVNQREIGTDSRSFGAALRAALRQDPDVILVGEMRDIETIALAVTAAETGHLVFGTLHTTSAVQTIGRIIDVFPHEAQQQIRMQLSVVLQTGQQFGMQTLEAHLVKLMQQGLVTIDDALSRANNPATVQSMLNRGAPVAGGAATAPSGGAGGGTVEPLAGAKPGTPRAPVAKPLEETDDFEKFRLQRKADSRA